ncbi:sporulation protein YpjB [Fictibacillus fluitans]|uniref:Sporulation protein YpjB n=1 Tax=Fictibacillus fluitans TaxID=3058422 RepID=A0ABT8I3N1_9BACL|nr:sporulation protein YpjB [Fictibacillus sp. NE201]MDN4527647.1 sporulation protein YpjB [Fictibacillus sp. NE201]
MGRKRKTAAALSAFLLLMPADVHAAGSDQHPDFDNVTRLSDKALELAKEERYKEASEVLFYMSSQFGKDVAKSDLADDKIRMVDMTMENTIETLGRAEESRDVKISTLTGVRLLMDALVSDHQPLWKQTEYQIMNPIKAMQLSLKKREDQSFQEAANEFLANYNMIRPAVSMDVTEAVFDQVDGDVQYIEGTRTNMISAKESREKLTSIQKDFEKLFDAKEDSSDPSLFWLIFSIGGIIFSTLFYVGWRKYKAETESVKAVEKPEE